MSKHVMIDIETMDTAPTAIVLSIGAVAFDIDTFEIAVPYYAVLDAKEQEVRGRTIGAETMRWWMRQSREAQAVFQAPPIKVGSALESLGQLLADAEGVWGNGADFDCVILGSLYESMGVARPWSYGKNRCLRTLKNLRLPKRYVKPVRQGVHHNALDDAVYQVAELRAICEAEDLSF